MPCNSLNLPSVDSYRVLWSESDTMKHGDTKKIMGIIDIQNIDLSNKSTFLVLWENANIMVQRSLMSHNGQN